MFIDKRYKDIFGDEMIVNRNKDANDAELLAIRKLDFFAKMQDVIVLFSQSTTIHGVVYLARRGLHIIER